MAGATVVSSVVREEPESCGGTSTHAHGWSGQRRQLLPIGNKLAEARGTYQRESGLHEWLANSLDHSPYRIQTFYIVSQDTHKLKQKFMG